MITQLNKINRSMSKSTVKNASVSIVLSILMIGFSLVRTALTSRVFGVESLGFLTIIIGILPYLSSSHNGLTSVGTSALYNDMHTKNYSNASKTIADIKMQYFLFGIFYLIITLIIAFAFPFIINSSGTILIQEPIKQEIFWYDSTLFILSNTVELFAVYFIVPISVILLFITKKAYISNSISIILTIVLNSIIIVLYAMIMNGTIDLSFIYMNIITFAVLGCKMFILLFILYFYRKKHFAWYKKEKHTKFKINKQSLQAVGSQYMEQFSTDITAIVFMVYAAINTTQINDGASINLHHGGDGGGSGANNFVPSAIYSTYLLILVSINEIVHSIVDASIPSVAEHASFNNSKINMHMFHRYQVLSIYISVFSVSSYILTSGMAQAIFLHEDSSIHNESNTLNIILICTLWIPMIFQTFNGMYSHLMPIFGMFKVQLKKSLYEVIVNLSIVAIISMILFFTTTGFWLMNGIFIALIGGSLISNMLGYFIARKKLRSFLVKDGCVNLPWTTAACFIWIFITIALMLPIYLIFNEQLNHLLDTIGIAGVVLSCVAIIFANFFISLGWVSLFRKDDCLFYVKEIKHIFKSEQKPSLIEK